MKCFFFFFFFISLETNLSYYTEKFVFSALNEDRTDKVRPWQILKQAPFFFGAFAAIQYYREDRPAARAYLQRYHLLLRTTVKYRLHLHEE